jgi:hypothetical protein
LISGVRALILARLFGAPAMRRRHLELLQCVEHW